ncbi:DUF1129 family protein [Enterococcus faecalis]|uniref:DUF1129 family protein n=1 Tax=Enterococcus faecalis TaxID=1351 RepID=A0A974NZP8_ENTFL|nr:DUF1129 family protein [Enterococcus faecalis]
MHFFDLKKSLKAANLSEEELALALHGIFTRINSRSKKQAKQPVSYLALFQNGRKQFLNKPAEVKEPAGWMIWLDNTLLLLGLLTIMLTAMSLFFKRNRTTSRINHIYLRCDGWGLCFSI